MTTFALSADSSCGAPNVRVLVDGEWRGFGTGVELLERDGVENLRNVAVGESSWYHWDVVTQCWQWNTDPRAQP